LRTVFPWRSGSDEIRAACPAAGRPDLIAQMRGRSLRERPWQTGAAESPNRFGLAISAALR